MRSAPNMRIVALSLAIGAVIANAQTQSPPAPGPSAGTNPDPPRARRTLSRAAQVLDVPRRGPPHGLPGVRAQHRRPPAAVDPVEREPLRRGVLASGNPPGSLTEVLPESAIN